MTARDFAIGVLSVTAVILFAGLAVVQSVGPRQAWAAGPENAPAAYIVATSRLEKGTSLLLVLDTAAEKMNTYLFNRQTGQIDMMQPPIPIDRLIEKPERGKK